MALPLTQLESSVDPHCRGQHKPAARMAVAASLCASGTRSKISGFRL